MRLEEKVQSMLPLVPVDWYSHGFSMPRNNVHSASSREQGSFLHHEQHRPPLPEVVVGVPNQFVANSYLTEHEKLAVTSPPMKIHAAQRPSEMLLQDQSNEQYSDLVRTLHADPSLHHATRLLLMDPLPQQPAATSHAGAKHPQQNIVCQSPIVGAQGAERKSQHRFERRYV